MEWCLHPRSPPFCARLDLWFGVPIVGWPVLPTVWPAGLHGGRMTSSKGRCSNGKVAVCLAYSHDLAASEYGMAVTTADRAETKGQMSCLRDLLYEAIESWVNKNKEPIETIVLFRPSMGKGTPTQSRPQTPSPAIDCARQAFTRARADRIAPRCDTV